MRRIVWGLIKLGLASLLAGWLLGLFGITADTLLEAASLSRQQVADRMADAAAWAAPRLTLGALIVVPVWFFTYLFLPSAED
ncbi:DUF6460 domain-containing protein [Gellertiella hungarica]|uniref:DUF6460 domain-containing protein n=1 Tax=Gellertiella hungarica TaxID=1572859 RepID=A0A7W6J542_9HYPH|nr:DUF6460 domain-containing protein [Gellertiella hungarica]MBB4064172.1 hypothetical protein [Gellertiella hungarica]